MDKTFEPALRSHGKDTAAALGNPASSVLRQSAQRTVSYHVPSKAKRQTRQRHRKKKAKHPRINVGHASTAGLVVIGARKGSSWG